MRNFFLVIIAILLGATAARAHDVLVIQGLRVKPYDEAYRGFRSSCDADTRRVYLPDIDKTDLGRLVREERPRLIVAIGADALASAQKVKNIPVLYLMVLHPQAVVHGNRNITGVAMNAPPEKYFDLLKKISPAPRTIGLVYDPAKSGYLAKRAQQAARARGMELTALEVSKPSDVPRALTTLKGAVDALLMLPDTTVVTSETVEFFLLFSQNNGIPVISFASKYVDLGALLSLDIDGADQGRQAGEMARRILDGAAVSDLPSVEARRTHLKTNRSVARKLGITLDSIDR
ncbi:MAG TPA: ABC transporter substrate-binding protein [Geobacteraceae bacterium]|nr:ABC transporter substrate-binding protein [Geobacteraceae bacterium]